MEISFCCPTDKLPRLIETDIRNVELPGSALAFLPIEKFNELRGILSCNGFKVASVNVLVSGITPLAEAEKLDEAKAYINNLFPRIAGIGCHTAVFGCGVFRMATADKNYVSKLKSFIRDMSDAALQHGITIALEPLNTKECNILNSSLEALSYVKEIHHPALRMLIDLYHFDLENESLQNVTECGNSIRHVHIALPKIRSMPNPTDNYDYKPFLTALKETGYNGYVSVEASSGDVADMLTANSYLNKLLREI